MLTVFRVLITTLILCAPSLQADYTELYGKGNTTKPQVLIVFDTSGSMGNASTTYGKSRMKVAKEVVVKLIKDNANIDFGLVAFNYNAITDADLRIFESADYPNTYPYFYDFEYYDGWHYRTRYFKYLYYKGVLPHGGRVVNDVGANHNELIANIEDNLTANGSTPLCETMYEVYRYYSGGEVYYGNDRRYNQPLKDQSAESSVEETVDGEVVDKLKYSTPFQTCQKNAYVILMTDGEPIRDYNADDNIKTLTGASSKLNGSYMPHLTDWMKNNDVNSEVLGVQNIVTYTVGFGIADNSTEANLLQTTAQKGGGTAYLSNLSVESLSTVFNSILSDVIVRESALSSPSIATNSADRTRSLNSLYYSMFLPDNHGVWKGNIKKLTMSSAGVVVDSNGNPAINMEGNIKQTASTYWGGVQDGNNVESGGVVDMLSAATSRKVLSNIGTGGVLAEPNQANLISFYADVNDADQLAAKLEVNSDDLENRLKWLRGIDVDNSDGNDGITDFRNDIFADPLHSVPLAVTYEELDTDDNPIQKTRILVGTNAGFLHMFTDNGDTVTENWAFIPENLLKYGVGIKDLISDDHSYGLDLSPMIVRSGDQIYVIIGQRRGGSSYYSLNITDPDHPSYVGSFSNKTTGLSELGQTWSVPVVANLKYTLDGDTEQGPVLVFGGGYDPAKDNCVPSESINCEDSKGSAIYITTLTGSKIWSTEDKKASCSEKHCLKDSIASKVSLLDSDADGFFDRIYAGDTGGNVWRVDLKGYAPANWALTKLAKLGGDTAATDRRFFTTPVIARTYKDKVTGSGTDFSLESIAYDAVLIASGDKTKPLEKVVNNQLYLIQDTNILPMTFADEDAKPDPKILTDLKNISDDPIGTIKEDESKTDYDLLNAYVSLTAKDGWYYNLQATGEKSLGDAVVLNGIVYFPSFAPNDEFVPDCSQGDFGEGSLYALDIHSGIGAFKTTNGSGEGDPVKADKISTGERVTGDVAIYVDEDGNIRMLTGGKGDVIIVDDKNEATGNNRPDAKLLPKIIYSYFEER